MNSPLPQPKTLTEAEETKRGQLIAQVLGLRRVGRDHPDHGKTPERYQTEWGTKTALGIFRTVARIVEDGE